ncbi:TIGR02117 family protein [Cyanobium sp. LEGE 06113]|uniref:TIGR02117 family protein n=1 Tax=Cyanobium sp. LEGE 06113 TaxID=1297573 RepID=UPI001881C451|nr:TIGR02117 family protein [Cyanobium sp. LEGE 06113]MBE9153789.1 TIGR02117 family protein [Cyanobium sp. LEGE 06113]
MKLAGILFGAVALTACSSSPTVVGPAQDSSHALRSHPVHVVNHGWHAGLIIPARHLNREIPELKQGFGPAAYYEIGWGDRAFYQAQHTTADLGLQALFRSKGSVLHVVAIPDSPAKAFNHLDVVSTCLTKQEMASVVEFVANSFVRGHRGSVLPINQGLYGNSRFFAGTGSYSLLNTCNTWIAKGLKSAGLDLSPSLTLTSGSVISAVRSRRQLCTPRPHPTAQ